MKTWNSLMIIGAVAVGSLVAFSANAIIAYDTPQATAGNSGNGWDFGEIFQVGGTALTVSQLGAFDAGANGWGGGTVYVAIYNMAGGQVSPVATFSDAGIQGTFISAGSSYRFQPVTAFQLNANTTYEVVAGSANNQFYTSLGAPTLVVMDNSGYLTFGNGVGDTGNRWSGWGGALAFPGTADGGPVGRYAAGSFSFTPVPEVTAFGVAGVGLLGLVYLGRCARRMKVA